MSNEFILQAENLVRHQGNRDVVGGVSFSVVAGEAIGLVGPSGCGKTSLLHMVGLLDRPSAGRVLIKGRDLWHASARERTLVRLEDLGFVFQHSNLLPHLTARENVALPRWRLDGDREAALRKADELLDRFSLGGAIHQRAGALSLGEAQRVAVARSLINGPSLVFADEPTGSLDTANADRVITALLELCGSGVAVIVATHDLEVAGRLGRRLSMRDGKLVEPALPRVAPVHAVGA